MERELATTFLASLGTNLPAPAPGCARELESALRQAYAEAQAQWPGVEISPALFARHVAERLPDGGSHAVASLLERMSRMSLDELYLACACAHGIPAAISTLERYYLAKLPGLLGYLKQPEAMVDDICQMTRIRILVRTAEGGPRIAEYRGQGSLLSWLKVTAARVTLTLRASEKPAPCGGEELLEALPAPGGDAELDLIKRRHGADLRVALREAFAAIGDDDRYLLRLYVADRLTTTQLGVLFRVNQSTISRRLKSAREHVREETRRRLQKHLGLSARGVQSVLADLDSRPDLGLGQLFGDEVPGLARDAGAGLPS